MRSAGFHLTTGAHSCTLAASLGVYQDLMQTQARVLEFLWLLSVRLNLSPRGQHKILKANCLPGLTP